MLNRIKVSKWDFDGIDKDFDIYQVVLDKHSNKNILDTSSDIKVLSTVYYSGQQCFVMTHKGQTDEAALQYIYNKELKGGKSCAVHQVRTKMLSKRPEAFRRMFGYRGRALLQLLINSTLNAVFPEDEYNNITGRCYYWNPLWNENPKSKIELIDLTIERDMVMYPTVCTFTKDKPQDGQFPTRIVYDRLNNVIRKALSSDNKENIYYKQGIEGTHSTRPYDGTTIQYWERSRLSCLARFYRLTKKEIQQYVEFSFEFQDIEKIRPEEISANEDRVVSILKENSISIFDNVVFSDKESLLSQEQSNPLSLWIEDSRKAYKQEIKRFCQDNGIIVSEDPQDLYALRLEIIREATFYEINSKELKDVYSTSGNVVCQHLTVPVNYTDKKGEVMKSFQSKMATIYKELAIKADIREQSIRVVDWTQYHTTQNYTFFISSVCSTEKEKKQGIRAVRFTGMTIKHDGTFETENFKVGNIRSPQIADERQRAIMNLFFSSTSNTDYYDRNIELAIIQGNDLDRAYIIRRTNIRAMSNIEEMEKDFLSEKKDIELNCAIIADSITPLQFDSNSRNIEVYNNIMAAIRGRETILKSEILPLLTPPLKEGQKKPTISTKAKEMITNATGVIFKVSRRKSDEARLGTSAYKDISVWESPEYDKDDSENRPEPPMVTNYTVGQYEGLNQSIATSPVVRQISCKNGSSCQKEKVNFILKLMQVGFVKSKNYTVLPFPAKYLREIQSLAE